MRRKAEASCSSMIRRVTSSTSYGTTGSFKKVVSGSSASAICAATRSSALPAARSGEMIAGAGWCRLGHQIAQVGKRIGPRADGVVILTHAFSVRMFAKR